MLQESTSLPVAYMIPCVRFVRVVGRFVHPSQSRNTRYGWLAIPYPAGTLTLQETPGLAWRTRWQVCKVIALTPILPVKIPMP